MFGERGEHRPGRRVELREGRKAQDQLDRADHADRAVLAAVEVLPLGVRADHQADGAMGVDVIRAVLGVVLDDEDRDLGPVLAVADRFDDSAEGQVVAGHAGPAGCNVPGRVPVVWSSPRLMTMNRGRVSVFSNSANSRMNVSAHSGVASAAAAGPWERRNRGTCGRPGPARRHRS